jgi:hypothetical protein
MCSSSSKAAASAGVDPSDPRGVILSLKGYERRHVRQAELPVLPGRS